MCALRAHINWTYILNKVCWDSGFFFFLESVFFFLESFKNGIVEKTFISKLLKCVVN